MKKEYIIKSNIIKGSITFGIMTDIHYDINYNINKLYKLLDKYIKNKVDYILILGDILNTTTLSKSDLIPLIEFLKNLNSKVKTFVILGNHDHTRRIKRKRIVGDNDYFLNFLKTLNNIRLLNNEKVEIFENINITGLDFSFEYYELLKENKELYLKYIDKYLKNLDPKKFNILLEHSPLNAWDNSLELNNIDLVLSGHEHNGCIPSYLDWLPGTNGLIGVHGEKLKLFTDCSRKMKKINNRICIVFRPIITFSSKYLKWLNVFYPVTEQYVKITKA